VPGGTPSITSSAFKHRDGSGDLGERAFGLSYFQFSRKSFAVEKVDRRDQLLLCLDLLPGDGKAGLQAAHADIEVRGLRGHGQTRSRCTGFRCLVLSQRGFPPAAQAPEYVQLPGGAEVCLIAVAIPVKARGCIEQLPERGLDRLMRSCCLRAGAGRRQQGRIGQAEPGARLGDAR
jgi:hypothetical protein